jgi:Ni,Fe-hydrogenase III large subunit
MLSARSVRSRLQGIGVVSPQAAQDIGLVGLAARASGLATDSRAALPGRLHTAHPIELQVEPDGDCQARLRVRLREIDESLRWLQALLDDPGLDLVPGPPISPAELRPGRLCISLREGFRGPVLQAWETDAAGRLLHVKLQDPSLLNWFGLALAVRDNEISDFPVCNKSFDLSYCGNDL